MKEKVQKSITVYSSATSTAKKGKTEEKKDRQPDMTFVTQYEKYVATPLNARNVLAEYGVAIIPNVLDDAECEEMVRGMWDVLEHWTKDWPVPIGRDNPSSWRGLRDLFPKHSMLIQHYELGHAQFIWNLRQNPKCAQIFAHIWQCATEDLLVSFDGASFHMPPELNGNLGWYRNAWLHTDQSYTQPDFQCVQGWVTGLDVAEGDGTLAFLEKSHTLHREFAETFGITSKDNWFKLEEAEQTRFYLQRGCSPTYIACPRGSVVLWDSRTVHCGVEPRRHRTTPRLRCVAYLCYMPRTLASASDLQKKRDVFLARRMTTHWPCKVKMFARVPRTYGNPVKAVAPLPPEQPQLSALGRRLAGFD
eukprot:gene31337-37869_t